MEKLNKILKERLNGLFLLLLAAMIVCFFSFGSQKAESKNGQGVTNNKISNEKQISGEIFTGSEEEIQRSIETNATLQGTEVAKNATNSNPSVSASGNLKDNLKKYCDKSGNDNRSKCKKYCLKTKEKKQYKDLLEKYCENKKNEDKNTNIVIQAEEIVGNELNFIVGAKEFKIEFEEGESVFDIMKRAKSQGKIDFKYDDFGGNLGILITEINGVKNGSDSDWTQNKYWILYVSGKSSSIGCSGHKLNKSDTSIEWKYEKYS